MINTKFRLARPLGVGEACEGSPTGLWRGLECSLKEISAEYTGFSLPNYPLNHLETS